MVHFTNNHSTTELHILSHAPLTDDHQNSLVVSSMDQAALHMYTFYSQQTAHV